MQWLYLGFPLGALLPVIPWYLAKLYPNHKKFLAKLSIPLLLDGAMMAPQVPTNVLITGFLSAWLSQRVALRRYPEWYERYSGSSEASGRCVLHNSLIVLLKTLYSQLLWTLERLFKP